MKKVLLTLALVLFLAASAIATIWALVHFVGLQASLIWTAVIGAGAWAVRSNIEQKREYQRLLADKKREQYYQFLEFLNKFVSATELEDVAVKGISPEELRKWSLRLTLIGSDDVVRAWNDVRAGDNEGFVMMRNWGQLWLAMRKDCGHPDTQLKTSEILASILNDIEKHRSQIDEA